MVIFIFSSTNTTATASFENFLKIPVFFRKLKTKPYQCTLLPGYTQVTDSKIQLPRTSKHAAVTLLSLYSTSR